MAVPVQEIPQEMARQSEYKTFSDPIHGHITLHPLCIKIIDTPQFQRLRYISQLSGNYFVYPGVSHSRFEHSLGVCHLAREMVETLDRQENPELDITPKDKLCVQIAGLCHDLGHGPFSHLFDKKFIRGVIGENWKHEDGSLAMFDHLRNYNISVKDAFEVNEIQDIDIIFIKELIKGDGNLGRPQKNKKFLYQIIANKETEIDVDKWDYFARDCHGLGIKCMFDYTRLMKFMRVIKDKVTGNWDICFRDKEVSNIYAMFDTRALLHRKAYQHKTCVATQQMILEALVEANPYIRIKGRLMSECIRDMDAYTDLDDRVLYLIITSNDERLGAARNIIQRIYERKLYVCVGQTKPKEGYMTTGEQNEAKDTLVNIMDPPLKNEFFLNFPTFDYGQGDSNPVDGVKFYSKHNPDLARNITQDQVSCMLPRTYRDQMIRCYSRSLDTATTDRIRECFVTWSEQTPYVYSVELEDGYQNIV